MSHMTLLTGPERRRRWDDDVRERMAFTDFGIETLRELLETYKAYPDRLKRLDPSE